MRFAFWIAKREVERLSLNSAGWHRTPAQDGVRGEGDMARPLRIQYPGAYYHVTCRGNERREIFRDDGDRRKFLVLLARSLEIYCVALFVYVLMPNHFHLVLRTLKANLSEFMRHFNICYTMAFNWAHGRVGHLYQGRYKAFLIDADSYLMEVSRYTHLNPVRGEKFKGATVDEKWRHLLGCRESSLLGYLELAPRQPFVDYGSVLGYFGGDSLRGRRAYARFIRERLEEDGRNPLEMARGHGIVGGEAFIAWVTERICFKEEDRREQPAVRKLGMNVAPEDLIERYCAITGERQDAVCRRGRRTDSRLLLQELLYRYCDLTGTEIGMLMGGVDYATVSHCRAVLRSRMEKDGRLVEKLEELAAQIVEKAKGKI